MPRLKAVELPRDFVELNEALTAAKAQYIEMRETYKVAVENLARNGYRTGHIYGISPIPYPTLRKWMDVVSPTPEGYSVAGSNGSSQELLF